MATPNAVAAPTGARRHAPADRTPQTNARRVAVWLIACCALVFAMIVVGGITRLTHAGLSITEWQPIAGALPPLDAAQWQDAFSKYQATPEYEKVNHGMSLGEFKRIFWWEYAHRLLGRLIGIAFLVPLLFFIVTRQLPGGMAWPLLGIFALGGLQGAAGWYMVASGLVDDPRVSHLRLTVHLGLAFAILGAMLWAALSLLRPRQDASGEARPLRRFAMIVATGVFVMVLTGGMVAGLRAGFAYNTFPLMNGSLVPPEILMLSPWWRNFVWNMATVQFDHRLLALVLLVSIVALSLRIRGIDTLPSRSQRAGNLLLVAVLLQIALGIATLLLVVPLPLAALHQAGAVLLFAAAINAAHALR